MPRSRPPPPAEMDHPTVQPFPGNRGLGLWVAAPKEARKRTETRGTEKWDEGNDDPLPDPHFSVPRFSVVPPRLCTAGASLECGSDWSTCCRPGFAAHIIFVTVEVGPWAECRPAGTGRLGCEGRRGHGPRPVPGRSGQDAPGVGGIPTRSSFPGAATGGPVAVRRRAACAAWVAAPRLATHLNSHSSSTCAALPGHFSRCTEDEVGFFVLSIGLCGDSYGLGHPLGPTEANGENEEPTARAHGGAPVQHGVPRAHWANRGVDAGRDAGLRHLSQRRRGQAPSELRPSLRPGDVQITTPANSGATSPSSAACHVFQEPRFHSPHPGHGSGSLSASLDHHFACDGSAVFPPPPLTSRRFALSPIRTFRLQC